jgi:integrase
MFLPVIGHQSVLSLTSSHGDTLVAALDAKIAAGAMSDKTARNVWGTVGRMMRDAAHAKPSTGLRCLDANPFRDVQPPERSSVKRAKQFLYPSEFLAFVSCAAVPIHWRINAAIAVYLGLRDGEQRALRWEHVDLEHGIVNVCEVFDRHAGASREGTKSGASRTVPILPELVPLLRELAAKAEGGGLVCRGVASQRAMARGLRTWLRRAGVTRAALFASTTVNMAIRWHDLRATCGTWLAVASRSATDIRDVLGHTQVSMTDRYMRNASAVRGGQFGEPFPALPAIRHSIVIDDSGLTELAKNKHFERGGRDSNPRPPA